MKVLDLFSGIGGFSLGLERVGMKTIAFCENNSFCRLVLAKHWPEVPCFDDVRTLKSKDVEYADVICGGPPCQPFSSASRGRRKGTGDNRWLWPEMYRFVYEIRPTWILFENVSHVDDLGLEQVAYDMEAAGYEVWPFWIGACAVRLDHIRTRCWVVGYADRNSKPKKPFYAKMGRMPECNISDTGKSGIANGISGGLDGHRIRALGNAVTPRIVEQFGYAMMGASKSRGASVARL